MSGDIDLDCGDIIEGGVTLEEKGKQIFDQIVRVASGHRTKSEKLGFGGWNSYRGKLVRLCNVL